MLMGLLLGRYTNEGSYQILIFPKRGAWEEGQTSQYVQGEVTCGYNIVDRERDR